MPVLITKRTRSAPHFPTARLQVLAQQMLEWLGCKDRELSVLLCDDKTICDLNHRFRNTNKPTDVLAFPADDARSVRGAATLLGDVAISLQTAQAQASKRSVSLLDETAFLLAHGLLHLLGMDHNTPRKAASMNRRTNALLHAVGLVTPKGAVALAPLPRRKSANPSKAKAQVGSTRRRVPK